MDFVSFLLYTLMQPPQSDDTTIPLLACMAFFLLSNHFHQLA